MGKRGGVEGRGQDIVKALIITGDDFGISPQVNQAIIKAHREGILTSASLVVGGKAFEEAVDLARANPGLSVGLHIVLVQGKSVLPHQRIPQLVDEEGNFPSNPILAGLRYFFQGEAAKEIREELKAQIEKFLSTGLTLAFINGHLNIHVHPRVFGIIMELGQELGIKNFRLPREELLLTLRSDRSRMFSKLFHSITFNLLSRYCKSVLEEKGFHFTDKVYGLLQSGDMNASYVRALIRGITRGVNEVYFHPCLLPCPEYSRWMPEYHPGEELEVLVSKEIKELISASSIQLVDYSALQ